MTQPLLPAGFAELEPFTQWALPTENERNTLRISSKQEDLQAYVDVILPRAEDITKLVDATEKPWPEPVERLFLMLLSLAEVAPAIESYGQPTVVDGYASERFQADETHVLRPQY